MNLQHSAVDVMGDVHGMIKTLRAMLDTLGYRKDRGGAWHHPDGRHLVSIGDLIDDGPQPLDCLDLIAEMVRDGCATMLLGNHEFNGVLFMRGLRANTDKNARQFQPTLEQIDADPERWKRLEQFLSTCPTHVEVAGLRIIHACWHEPSVAQLPEVLDSAQRWERAGVGDLEAAFERCLKGPEEDCAPMKDRRGIARTKQRVRWWESYPQTAPRVVFGHYALRAEEIHGAALVPGKERHAALWLGEGHNAACIDYGAVHGGPLVALRWPEDEFVVQGNLDVG